MPTRFAQERVLLDVHCEIDDGFALCGGNKVPRLRYDQFIQLGTMLVRSDRLRSAPWQRCLACVAVVEAAPQKGSVPQNPNAFLKTPVNIR